MKEGEDQLLVRIGRARVDQVAEYILCDVNSQDILKNHPLLLKHKDFERKRRMINFKEALKQEFREDTVLDCCRKLLKQVYIYPLFRSLAMVIGPSVLEITFEL